MGRGSKVSASGRGRPWQGRRILGAGVVNCKHSTQDVCMVNKVRKYHSMCQTVDSVYIAIKTQQQVFG